MKKEWVKPKLEVIGIKNTLGGFTGITDGNGSTTIS